ncbi:MAG: hypothetical protein H6812_04435 [Phycisphaeraceae bacterium]|nr:hypothetical protein [Phycisphaerales bacterium]MCB9842485.1 hypothetical protein [Phycisphaeraceae bacterium]
MTGYQQDSNKAQELSRDTLGTALHAALNTADEQYGRAAQHVMKHGGGRLAAYLDFSGSIDIGDDVRHDLPISATLRLKHERSSDHTAMAKYSGELDGGKIRFRGKAALGGPNYIPLSPSPPQ